MPQPDYFKGTLAEEEDLNHENIVNLEEEYLISKFYDEVFMGVSEMKNGEWLNDNVHDGH